jgi:hypothetical protein
MPVTRPWQLAVAQLTAALLAAGCTTKLPPPETGADGQAGAPGLPGPDGQAGRAGRDGQPGQTGQTGQAGPQGPQGAPGLPSLPATRYVPAEGFDARAFIIAIQPNTLTRLGPGHFDFTGTLQFGLNVPEGAVVEGAGEGATVVRSYGIQSELGTLRNMTIDLQPLTFGGSAFLQLGPDARLEHVTVIAHFGSMNIGTAALAGTGTVQSCTLDAQASPRQTSAIFMNGPGTMTVLDSVLRSSGTAVTLNSPDAGVNFIRTQITAPLGLGQPADAGCFEVVDENLQPLCP